MEINQVVEKLKAMRDRNFNFPERDTLTIAMAHLESYTDLEHRIKIAAENICIEAYSERFKHLWYVLDEMAVLCSSRHTGRTCPVCEKIKQAMELCPDKPTPEECQQYYEERN
jgi:hypothetical protein